MYIYGTLLSTTSLTCQLRLPLEWSCLRLNSLKLAMLLIKKFMKLNRWFRVKFRPRCSLNRRSSNVLWRQLRLTVLRVLVRVKWLSHLMNGRICVRLRLVCLISKSMKNRCGYWFGATGVRRWLRVVRGPLLVIGIVRRPRVGLTARLRMLRLIR